MGNGKNELLSNIWKLRVIRLFFWMHFFAAVLVPFYTDWGGLKLSQVLFLNSWFMFWNFALEVPTGTVADFLGRKASIVLGSVVAAIAAVLYVSAPNFYVFLAAEFVFAIAYTLHSGADEALAYDSLKLAGEESRSKSVLASMESFKLVGIVIATVVGAFIASSFSYAAPMLAYVVPALAACLVALSLREPPVLTPTERSKSYASLLKEGAVFFAKHRILLVLALELAITNAFAWGIIWLYQPLLLAAGMPIKYLGVVHAACCVGQIVLLSHIERIDGWLGSKKKLLLVMAGLTGVLYMSLAFLTSVVAITAAVVLAFTFSLPRIPVFSSYMNKFIPSEKRATVLSMTSMCRTLGIVVVNPVIGVLADWSVPYTMLILGVLILVATGLSRIEEAHLVD